MSRKKDHRLLSKRGRPPALTEWCHRCGGLIADFGYHRCHKGQN